MTVLLTNNVSENVILSLIQDKLKTYCDTISDHQKLQGLIIETADIFLNLIHTIIELKSEKPETREDIIAHKTQNFQSAFAEGFFDASKNNSHKVFSTIWVQIINKLEDELEDSKYNYARNCVVNMRKGILGFVSKFEE